MRRAIGLMALEEYPPGVVEPSTVGSGRRVSRLIPITQRIVLIALTPWQPALRAARAGSSIRVTFGVIFAQTGFPGRARNPIAHFQENFRVLAHGGAHLAFGKPVRARKVELKTVNSRMFAAFDDLEPCVPAILLHDRRNQDPVGILILASPELFKPDLDRAVADEFDVLPSHDFALVRGVKLSIPRGHVNDFRSVKADCLAMTAPQPSRKAR